jgi:hypothetical protein
VYVKALAIPKTEPIGAGQTGSSTGSMRNGSDQNAGQGTLGGGATSITTEPARGSANQQAGGKQ